MKPVFRSFLAVVLGGWSLVRTLTAPGPDEAGVGASVDADPNDPPAVEFEAGHRGTQPDRDARVGEPLGVDGAVSRRVLGCNGPFGEALLDAARILDGGIAHHWATAGGPSLEIQEIDYAEVLREKQAGQVGFGLWTYHAPGGHGAAHA